jgi:hypothetical protein
MVVTGRVELSNGSPGGYVVEDFMDQILVNTDKTASDGSYTISSDQTLGFAPNLLRLSRVICRGPGKYAYSPLDFQRNGLLYVANVPPLTLLSTTEGRYRPEEARKTIQVLVTVQAIRYRAGKIGTSELNVIDAIKVLEKTALGRNPQATKRAIVDNLVLDPSLPSEVLDQFRRYLR